MTLCNALFFSDLHLGWWPARRDHLKLMAALYDAAEDAELIVLNGDIIDHMRQVIDELSMEAIYRLQEIIGRWRQEGRQVIYIEGNHDPLGTRFANLAPSQWKLDLRGQKGERIRVLHGHRFEETPPTEDSHHFMAFAQAFENHTYATLPPLARLYPHLFRPIIGWIGDVDTKHWQRQVAPSLLKDTQDVDILVCGHLHFGPGIDTRRPMTLARSGAWVNQAQRGSANRLLRYKGGQFYRIRLEKGLWQPCTQNR